jgi:drug/metabolite transporter (DMT)-like permease
MSTVYVWATIFTIVLCNTCGDVLLSKAMKQIGALDVLRREHGLLSVAKRVLTSGKLLLSICFMAGAFYSLLAALSRADVSLVIPASASLTFVCNAIAAKIFLHENVDRRRWVASVLICMGVALLAV